jgi:hypothetical protein
VISGYDWSMDRNTLLTRDEFKRAVFMRDDNRCVLCDKPAVDAHHILERRLWGGDGGYYIDNGASVCAEHHMMCETTGVSVEDVRKACGITNIIVPSHMDVSQPYDKWGNPILSNGQRLKGDIFFDAGVQKVLAPFMNLFTDHVKYPRTFHVPWSEGATGDDRVLSSMSMFEGKHVAVTHKMDGENTSLYRDKMHARSVDSIHHPSRDWVKANVWSRIRHDIPERWRVCGENMYAEHSIRYEDLHDYFLGFSVWNDRNVCLSWDDTLVWFSLLDVVSVPVMYYGIYNESVIRSLWNNEGEGYVIRNVGEFAYGAFKDNVAKFVRKNHVQTSEHWAREEMRVNALRQK